MNEDEMNTAEIEAEVEDTEAEVEDTEAEVETAETAEAEKSATEAETKKKHMREFAVIGEASFCDALLSIVPDYRETGKTAHGAWEYVFTNIAKAYIERVGKKSGGYYGNDAEMISLIQRYFSDEVKEGEKVDIPQLSSIAVPKPSPKKELTPEEIAKKAAKDAEREAKKKAREEAKAKKERAKKAHEEMMNKWRQQSFTFA